MNDKQTFSSHLGAVPPVPEDILPAVHRRVKHRRTLRRTGQAMAVAVLLLAGVFSFEQTRPSVTHTTPLPQTVADELQTAHDYLYAAELESEIDVYALVDPALF